MDEMDPFYHPDTGLFIPTVVLCIDVIPKDTKAKHRLHCPINILGWDEVNMMSFKAKFPRKTFEFAHGSPVCSFWSVAYSTGSDKENRELAAVALIKTPQRFDAVFHFTVITVENPGSESARGHSVDPNGRKGGRGFVGHPCIEHWTEGWTKLIVAYCAYGSRHEKYTALWINYDILTGDYGFQHHQFCRGKGQCQPSSMAAT